MSFFSIHNLPVNVHLCYDTIYYVESPNNWKWEQDKNKPLCDWIKC